MEQLTITQVAARYDVTPRMLRHYEKLGLLASCHREDYAYRTYDEEAIRRLQRIILLRKLRLPLQDIAVILTDADCTRAMDIVQQHIQDMNHEIASLAKVRDVLVLLLTRLQACTQRKITLEELADETLNQVVQGLTISKGKLKERVNMEELNKANEMLNRSLPVRRLMLPPYTVASYQFIGPNPETKVGDVMSRFVQESHLYEKKPDARMFGFNHPDPGVLPDGVYGYEVWVTIPEDMEVSAPLEKKQFAGGLYAAMTIRFPEFHLWGDLVKWGQDENNEFELEWRGDENTMGGLLEEHVNWVYSAHLGWPKDKPFGDEGQIDLLLPIKKRQKQET